MSCLSGFSSPFPTTLWVIQFEKGFRYWLQRIADIVSYLDIIFKWWTHSYDRDLMETM